MSEAFFYHLTRTPLEDTLAMLLSKARAVGWRVAVRGTMPDRIQWLDLRLWAGEGFLPHGVSGGPFDAEQPILLTTELHAANAPDCVISIDGAEIRPQDIPALKRAMVLFDGNDASALEHARGQWKLLTTAGCKAKYWSQASGRWEMQAESSAS